MSKKEEATCSPCAPSEYKPTVYLDLRKANLEKLEGMKPGDKITVVVKGEVESFSMRKPWEHSDEKGNHGNITLEVSDMKFIPSNMFSELVEEEDE